MDVFQILNIFKYKVYYYLKYLFIIIIEKSAIIYEKQIFKKLKSKKL